MKKINYLIIRRDKDALFSELNSKSSSFGSVGSIPTQGTAKINP